MLSLALDTCQPSGGLAVLQNDTVLHTLNHESSEEYSSWLLPAVAKILGLAEVALPTFNFYTVAAGPGSFTGVRVSLATVKAWSEIYGRPIAGVSRLEALATLASGQAPYIAAFADAQRNQVYGAIYRRSQKFLELVGEEVVIAPEKFVGLVVEAAGGNRPAWISAEPLCLTATAAWKTRQAADESIQVVSPFLAPAIGKLGYRFALEGRLTDALSLDANYVRRSDAQSKWSDASKPSIPAKQTHPHLILRKLELRDADAVDAITVKSPDAAQWSRESYLALDRKSQSAWVAETESGVTGFIVARTAANQAEILNLAVDPAQRRSGLATALLQEAVRTFRLEGVREIYLEVRESNRGAINFYTKHGFVRAGLRPGYYRQPVEGAVLMTVKLTD